MRYVPMDTQGGQNVRPDCSAEWGRMQQVIGVQGGLKIDIEHLNIALIKTLLRTRKENQRASDKEIWLPFPLAQDPHD